MTAKKGKRIRFYLMASVTPFWLAVCPTASTMGTEYPEGAPGGTTQFTWRTPAIIPGAAPSY